MSVTKTPFRLVIVTVLLCSLGFFLYYRYCTAAGILARSGVYFDDDATAFESSSLNEVRFWFDTPSGRLSGPNIVGDLLSVERPYRTADGHVEFAVQSGVYRDGRVRIQLLLPPQGDIAFHVADADTRNLNVHYPPQGIRGAP